MSISIDTNVHHARLLRTIGRELAVRIIPELSSADGVERTVFAQSVLEYLAADLDIAPALLHDLRIRYRQAIATVLDSASSSLQGTAQSFQGELNAIPVEEGLGAQREIAALRDLNGRLIRQLSDNAQVPGGAGTTGDQVKVLGALDFEWLNLFENAMAARAANPAAQSEAAVAIVGDVPVTREAMTKYLRRHFAGSPALEVTSVSIVPGGRSKRTISIKLANTDELPADLIMRQDMALKYAGPSICDEVGPLRVLGGLGLPAPMPLHYESGENEFGKPFFLTRHLPGSPPGDFFGLNVQCPGAMKDLARTLGRLHSMPLSALDSNIPLLDPRQLVLNRIEEYWQIWRRNTTRGSAVVDFAYAWARQVIEAPYECEPVYTHGDIGAHNWLVDNDKLSAVLDWEFLHVGDPAEDLGVARLYAEAVMTWDEFMQVYREAGGPEVAEKRIELAAVLYRLKGTTLVATSARNFVEGHTNDFIKGTNSFTGLRKIEMKLATLLKSYLTAA